MPVPLAGISVAVVTVSDRSSAGERPDRSGPILAEAFEALGAAVTIAVVPDGADSVEQALRTAIASGARVVITTGGTGISPRDQTPEGTAPVIARLLPGISERLRAVDAEAVPTAALSRGIAGLTAGSPPCLVVNVAGSTGAAKSAGIVLADLVPHALAQLSGADH